MGLVRRGGAAALRACALASSGDALEGPDADVEVVGVVKEWFFFAEGDSGGADEVVLEIEELGSAEGPGLVPDAAAIERAVAIAGEEHVAFGEEMGEVAGLGAWERGADAPAALHGQIGTAG